MTKQEAKILSLEVWTYFRDHPYLNCKSNLPDQLWLKIVNLICNCPLCEICNCDQCSCDQQCPLQQYNACGDYGYYSQWTVAKTDLERQIFAKIIVDIIEAWDPDAMEEKTKGGSICLD